MIKITKEENKKSKLSYRSQPDVKEIYITPTVIEGEDSFSFMLSEDIKGVSATWMDEYAARLILVDGVEPEYVGAITLEEDYEMSVQCILQPNKPKKK